MASTKVFPNTMKITLNNYQVIGNNGNIARRARRRHLQYLLGHNISSQELQLSHKSSSRQKVCGKFFGRSIRSILLEIFDVHEFNLRRHLKFASNIE